MKQVASVKINSRNAQTSQNTSILDFIFPAGITSSIQFVTPEIVLTEREGETVDVCVELLLLNNQTVLEHNISFYLIIENINASKLLVPEKLTFNAVLQHLVLISRLLALNCRASSSLEQYLWREITMEQLAAIH